MFVFHTVERKQSVGLWTRPKVAIVWLWELLKHWLNLFALSLLKVKQLHMLYIDKLQTVVSGWGY